MFESLFSVASLVSFALTVTVGLPVTIRLLKLNLSVNNKSHTINGNGNIIEHKEYNIIMQDAQRNVRNRNIFVGVLFLILFPFCTSFINTLLGKMATLAPWFCLCGVLLTLYVNGLKTRFWDAFYIAVTFFIADLASKSAVNSYYFLQNIDGLYTQLVGAFISYGSSLLDREMQERHLFILKEQLALLCSVAGFVMVSITLLNATFGYTKQRKVSGIIFFSAVNLLLGIMGYLLASGAVWYLLHNQNDYMSYILRPVAPVVNFLFYIYAAVPL
ncbi:hypothetical protein [Salmonella enterica]|uniref:Uncharacterized protein n=2 Tax=Salmonella enterica TaxID=28901 RepID=A0A3V7BAC1_SALER|nr:hypothetical protein [Salmonella enterica]EAA8668665.1 hypothetical protein [Salmonella enterica]EAS2066845.1 hypothetical protein [Salmonella enterica]EAS2072078.1 hypothetical protein [Salmonella enterica]EAX5489903.1 hypothetical protein [Salmonella enterica]EBT2375355.1 hypothetical protein [Salmonella enterica]